MTKKELNKELLKITTKGIKGSLEKQLHVFSSNKRNKSLYEKAVKLASY